MSRPAPFYADIADAPAGADAQFVTTSDGMELRFVCWSEGEKGTVLVLPGRTEYAEKYGPSVSRLTKLGYSVLVIDWRGQGLSSRPDKERRVGHVDDFSEFQTDLNTVLKTEQVRALPRPWHMFTHSMGGCIGLRALHKGLDVVSATYSAPMWGIGLPPLLRGIAQPFANLGSALGKALAFAPGTGPELGVLKDPFDKNELTNDPATYDWLIAHMQAHPELGLAGPSLAWLRAALDETRALMEKPLPRIPSLVFLGDQESIVDTAPVIRATDLAPGSELVICEGAKHEILMESQAIQSLVWPRIARHLAETGEPIF